MRYIVTLILMIFVSNIFFTVDSFAQRGRGWRGGCGNGNPCCRTYNSETEETISGEVVSVDKIVRGKEGFYGIHLTVKADEETVTVHLGPGWYIENQDMKIEAKDKVEITGSKVFYEGKPVITAYEVKKGDDVLVLRNEDGFPAWRGWRRLPDNQPPKRQGMGWKGSGGWRCGNPGCRRHNPELQEKLKKAMVDLKREIRIDVMAENGGTITGNVECKRVRYPENVVVSIEKVGDNIYPAPEEHGIIDQFNLTFVPHVLAEQKGTKIDFLNSDSVQHNVFSPPDCCQPFNIGTYDVGVVKTEEFNEACVIPILCNIHPEMSAFVVVLDNPYFSVTDKDGAFTIENVPPGTYKLNTWHESLKAVSQEVIVEAGKTVVVDFQIKKRK
ncbi:MAG: carboxypeptidase regulatory-like domain-containing protein [Planctomycetota bacterium]